MTRLELDAPECPRRRASDFDADVRSPRRVNWTAVAATAAIVIAILSWLAAGVGDYHQIGDRVLTLETLRSEDAHRMERIESKLDRLLERPPLR